MFTSLCLQHKDSYSNYQWMLFSCQLRSQRANQVLSSVHTYSAITVFFNSRWRASHNNTTSIICSQSLPPFMLWLTRKTQGKTFYFRNISVNHYWLFMIKIEQYTKAKQFCTSINIPLKYSNLSSKHTGPDKILKRSGVTLTHTVHLKSGSIISHQKVWIKCSYWLKMTHELHLKCTRNSFSVIYNVVHEAVYPYTDNLMLIAWILCFFLQLKR